MHSNSDKLFGQLCVLLLILVFAYVAFILMSTKQAQVGRGHLVCPNCHTCIGHVLTVKSNMANGEEDIAKEHEFLNKNQ